jgi:hypothetical protein
MARSLPVIQPEPTEVDLVDPTDPETTQAVLEATGAIWPSFPQGVPLTELYWHIGRRRGQPGISSKAFKWALYDLWEKGIVRFLAIDDANLNRRERGMMLRGTIAKGDQALLGYVVIDPGPAPSELANKYGRGPVPARPARFVPEKHWTEDPLEYVRRGAPLVVSYGAGVDSTAMLVRFSQLGIMPDAILFADVGSEKQETYDYLPVMSRFLREHGMVGITQLRYQMTEQGIMRRVKLAALARQMIRAGASTWAEAGPMLSDEQRALAGKKKGPIHPIEPRGYENIYDNCVFNQTFPSLAFGYRDHSCSSKWKVKPQLTWIEKSEAFGPLARAAWAAGLPVVQAIGFDDSAGDLGRRDRIPDDEHFMHWYPLQHWHWDRERCKAEIAAAGLPVPIKSACFFCPSTQAEEVEELVWTHPELIEAIEAMENAARPFNEHGPNQGLWFKGSMPKELRIQTGKKAWFDSGKLTPAELRAFVQARYFDNIETKPGRITDFVAAYKYLCEHHPDHPRCRRPNPARTRQPKRPPPQQTQMSTGEEIAAGVGAVLLATPIEELALAALLVNPRRGAEGKATFTGWTCVSGPAEFVDWLVDHGTEVSYRTFAKHVDVPSLDFWHASSDPYITWLRTELPSGQPAWVAQHSGTEHLCLAPGVDHEDERWLAVMKTRNPRGLPIVWEEDRDLVAALGGRQAMDGRYETFLERRAGWDAERQQWRHETVGWLVPPADLRGVAPTTREGYELLRTERGR